MGKVHNFPLIASYCCEKGKPQPHKSLHDPCFGEALYPNCSHWYLGQSKCSDFWDSVVTVHTLQPFQPTLSTKCSHPLCSKACPVSDCWTDPRPALVPCCSHYPDVHRSRLGPGLLGMSGCSHRPPVCPVCTARRSPGDQRSKVAFQVPVCAWENKPEARVAHSAVHDSRC